MSDKPEVTEDDVERLTRAMRKHGFELSADAMDQLYTEREAMREKMEIEVREAARRWNEMRAERDAAVARAEKAEAERDHWHRARQDALEGGEFAVAERNFLRARVAALEGALNDARDTLCGNNPPRFWAWFIRHEALFSSTPQTATCKDSLQGGAVDMSQAAADVLADMNNAAAYLRDEGDFNRSWTDGRRGTVSPLNVDYTTARISHAEKVERWAASIECASARLDRLTSGEGER